MASGFERQVRAREEYRRRNPSWTDSVSRYRALVGSTRTLRDHAFSTSAAGATGSTATICRALRTRPSSGSTPTETRSPATGVVDPSAWSGLARIFPFAGGSFDVVASAWVLEHLDHPGLVFSEVRRVLVPGGHFVFLTPNAWNYNAWMIRAIPHRWHAALTHRLYGRGEGDAYPVRYRANSGAQLAPAAQRRRFRADPPRLQRRSVVHRLQPAPPRGRPSASSALLAAPALRAARVHILGDAQA